MRHIAAPGYALPTICTPDDLLATIMTTSSTQDVLAEVWAIKNSLPPSVGHSLKATCCAIHAEQQKHPGDFVNFEAAPGHTQNTGDNRRGIDRLVVNGNISLQAGSLLTLSSSGFTPALNETWFLALNDGTDAVAGSFNSLPEGSLIPAPGGNFWQISYAANGDSGVVGNDIAVTLVPPASGSAVAASSGGFQGLQFDPVPEPSSALFAAAGAALLVARRRRNSL